MLATVFYAGFVPRIVKQGWSLLWPSARSEHSVEVTTLLFPNEGRTLASEDSQLFQLVMAHFCHYEHIVSVCIYVINAIVSLTIFLNLLHRKTMIQQTKLLVYWQTDVVKPFIEIFLSTLS